MRRPWPRRPTSDAVGGSFSLLLDSFRREPHPQRRKELSEEIFARARVVDLLGDHARARVREPLRPVVDPEDLVQAAAAVIVRSLPTLRCADIEHFRRCCVQILEHTIADHVDWLMAFRRGGGVLTVGLPSATTTRGEPWDLPDPHATPATAASRREEREIWRTALTKLDEDDRLLLDLRYGGAETLASIGRNLGLCSSGVHRRLMAARRRLQWEVVKILSRKGEAAHPRVRSTSSAGPGSPGSADE